jgi:hypothetical protein
MPWVCQIGKMFLEMTGNTYGKHPIADNLADIHFELPERESFSEFMREKGELLNA